jgi:1,4-alpha-glucan branching enzyme
MWTHPGKKVLFMGDEIAQWHEWNHDESVQWHLLQWESHHGMQKLVMDLNRIYKEQPALHEVDFEGHGFEWIDSQSRDESVLAFARRAKDSGDVVVVALNLTPVPRLEHRIGVPGAGYYEEIFNSDSERYAGSNIGNAGGLQAEQVGWHGREWSIEMALPPLGAVIFKAHWA